MGWLKMKMRPLVRVILALSLASCAKSSPPEEVKLPVTVTFDDRLHHFYAYGHKIQSPVIFSFEAGTLVINGFRPAPMVEDTVKAESIAAGVYKNVRYIQRLHSKGLTYRQAEDEFSRATIQSARNALDEYRRAEQAGDSNPVWRARMVLDTTVIDPRGEFSILSGTAVVVTQQGLGPIQYQLEDGPVRRISPQEEEANLRSSVTGRAASIRRTLLRETESLTIVSSGGLRMEVSGAEGIKKALSEIDQALRTGQARDGSIPKAALEEMIAKKAP